AASAVHLTDSQSARFSVDRYDHSGKTDAPKTLRRHGIHCRNWRSHAVLLCRQFFQSLVGFTGILCALAAFSSTVYRYHAIRCPKSSARLTRVITSPTNPLAAQRDIVCCPFCQVSFDAEVPSTQSA